ncbi:MAG: alpha/beta hydrolase-fold protein [Myxococcota bacterium]
MLPTRTRRHALALCLLAWSSACTSSRTPPAPPASRAPALEASAPGALDAVVRGKVRVAGSLATGRVRGRLAVAWATAEEARALSSGKADFHLLADLFGRYRSAGEVELGAGAEAPYQLAVPAGDVVVFALLDVAGQFARSLIKGDVAGNLTGQSLSPVRLARGGTAEHDVELTAAQRARGGPDPCTGERFQRVELDEPALAGRVRNATTRRFCIYLPPSWRPGTTRRWPVAYLLPGLMSAETARFGWPHAGRIADSLADETGRELILVGVDTSSALGSTYLVDSPTTGAWETFFTQRMVRELDATLPTLATSSARVLVGHSTGGFNAMVMALRHPEVFGAAVASSPDGLDLEAWMREPHTQQAIPLAVRWMRVEDELGGGGQFSSYGGDFSPDDSPRGFAWPIDLTTGTLVEPAWSRWMAHSPAVLLREERVRAGARERLSGRILLMVGRQDEFGLHPPTELFSHQLTREGVAHELVVDEGGHHLGEVKLRAQLKWALGKLDAARE